MPPPPPQLQQQRSFIHNQQQQHMNINHMLSPRAPASSALTTHQFSRKNSFAPPQDSKFNKFMHMWQRNSTNRVDPVTPNYRLSMPQPPQPLAFDRKAIESSSSVWRDPNQAPILTTTPKYDQVNMKQQRASFIKPQQPPSLPSADMSILSSPKLSSWLPGLFHFKQPKVCSLECEARDEREAIGKISQVLEEVSVVCV